MLLKEVFGFRKPKKLSPSEQVRFNPDTERLATDNPKMIPAIVAAKKDEDHEYVGSGLNAYVHRRNNPHNQSSVFRTSRLSDSGNVYLKFIYEHPELHGNPFLPRVVGVKEMAPGYVTYEVEKLTPFMTDQIIENKELIDSLFHDYFEVDPDKHFFPQPMRIGHFLESVESAVVYGDEPGFKIKNKQLRRAIEVIRAIKEREGYRYDIHHGNVMWRLTSHGPQLVFVDPLFAGWDKLNNKTA